MLNESSLKETLLQDKLQKIMLKIDQAFKADKEKAGSI